VIDVAHLAMQRHARTRIVSGATGNGFNLRRRLRIQRNSDLVAKFRLDTEVEFIETFDV
jgi:hypothetical protein